ncbi:mitochondrial oxaloacetate transport protein [Gamsiella multidivaricata]|uniref:mitochondrial oxaloacetate transport protein n=1 Tax=Gamsiella multidivaricata TaxID=101098 RepID=UPI00221E787A|nr:mitochondrial oxaloacetate transport protein [Gamsiella multidivaricata]KAI7825723.1 mitochondrial oxaloacetate transport protein [Gamsiella multidivaricata]
MSNAPLQNSPPPLAVAGIPTVVAATPTQVAVRKPSAVYGFIAAGIAACGAVTITNPAEVIKTRLQLQGELVRQAPGTARIYTNFGQAFVHIAKYEGIRGLQRGLGCAYMYQILMNGTRLGLYDPIKHSIHSLFKTDPGTNNSFVNIVAGGTGGLLSAALASPLFLIKTRLQSYSSHEASRVGHQHYYKHTFDGLRHVFKTEGVRGLYRGVDASMMRTGVGSSVQLPLYDVVKQNMIRVGGLENGALCHALSSLVSGFFLALAMNPFDIIATRMYNQAPDPVTGRGGMLYKSPIDCALKTVRTEGVKALYKGFTAHYLRIG